MLNYKYLLLENPYLAYVLLNIMNNINVHFYVDAGSGSHDVVDNLLNK
jgi:hypothetical protein